MNDNTSELKSNKTSVSITKPKTTREKIGLGLALLVLGAILVFGNSQSKNISSYTFASEPVIVEGFSADEVDDLKVPKRILIPDLSLDLVIKKARAIEGYWEVFDDSAAWGEGSGLPGEVGNQVLFAHSREGLFLPLRDVEEKMNIYVMTQNDWYRYEVKEIRQVFPNETQVIAPTDDETLTLYTCSGFNDSRRLIVLAKRV